jgi:uncharacterized protein (DUF885 family)
MVRLNYWSLLVLVALPVALAGQQQGIGEKTFPSPAVGVSSIGLRQTLTNYWEWRLSDEPELATGVGRNEYNNRWTDRSADARQRRRVAREEFLRQVRYVGVGNLTRGEHLNADLFEHELRTALEAGPAMEFLQGVSQMSGPHNRVFQTIEQMPAATVGDYENIIARLTGLPTYVGQSIALIREQLAAGLTQPAVVVDLMLDQVASQASATADETPLLNAFNTFPDSLAPGDRERLRREALAAYDTRFLPAWRALAAFLRDECRPRARSGLGITTVPNGRALYATLIKAYTTTALDAGEIHRLGLREVARIEEAMARVAREAGFTGTVAEYAQRLVVEPQQRFADRDEMLAYASDSLARAQAAVPRLFGRLPRMAVGVRPIPPDREAATASSYTAGTSDGVRQAWFNMNTYRPQDQAKYTIDALVLHETVPGHHLQIALARELEGVPEFRKVFGATAFTEGWALYAESLGVELGLYREPATRFGQLATELFRAVRLVVDTGIHETGWSRDQARAYFTGHAPSQSLAEVDRYIAWPGQALAYKIGELKIRELRRKVEQAKGADFDVREFHDAVLEHGALPLTILEQQIDAYLDPSRAPALR